MNRPGQIERMSRLLARRLEETGHSGDDAVSVADFHRRILPYHLCRDELGLATKAEYDQLVLELLGESGCVKVDEPLLSSAIRKERASPEPGIAFLQSFAASRLLLLDTLADDISNALVAPPSRPSVTESPARPKANQPARPEAGQPRKPEAGQPRKAEAEQLRRPEADRSATPRSRAGRPRPGRSEVDRAHRTARRRPQAERPMKPGVASRPCWSCAEELPARAGLRYCPHCGVDQSFRPCVSCDAEMKLSWAYCPMCGESASRPR